MSNTTPIQAWFEQYLKSRSIPLEVATAHGWRLVYADEIMKSLGRNDAHRIEAGILIPLADGVHQLRCYRQPVSFEGLDELILDDVKKAILNGVYDCPENEPFHGEWKLRAIHTLGDGTHQYEGRLVHIAGDEAQRLNYYPKSISSSTEKLAERHGVKIKAAKFISRSGEKIVAYAPKPIVGDRPLLIAEGATRALAVVATGAPVDVIAIQGAGMWHARRTRDLLPELAAAVQKATSVIVVLDGDWTSNEDVRRQLLQLIAAIRAAKSDADVRIGVPHVYGQPKAGLDDWLAHEGEHRGMSLMFFVRDALPADVSGAIEVLRAERYERDEDDVVFGRPADITEVILLASDRSLPAYEGLRRRFAAALGYDLDDVPKHPSPERQLYTLNKEGKRTAPSKSDVVQVAADYVFSSIPYILDLDHLEQPHVFRVTDGLCTSVTASAVKGAIRERLTKLMGEVPVMAYVDELWAQFFAQKPKHDIKPIRWSDETCYAFAELPRPVPGPAPAWEEILNRMSCRRTFLGWLWTLTLPEAEAGRQAMYLRGTGADGKSTMIEVLCTALGGEVSKTIQDLNPNNRFALQSLDARTRLLFLDDVRNVKILHYKHVRCLVSGQVLETERKGEHALQQRLHPRIIIASNYQLDFDIEDRAEASRILQVDVAARDGHGDSEWPQRLRAELPQLLCMAKEAWEQLHDGTDILLTDETRAIMSTGADDKEISYAGVLQHIHICSQHGCAPPCYVTSIFLVATLNTLGIRDEQGKYARSDFLKFIGARGARSKPQWISEEKRTMRVWLGIGAGNTSRNDNNASASANPSNDSRQTPPGFGKAKYN